MKDLRIGFEINFLIKIGLLFFPVILPGNTDILEYRQWKGTNGKDLLARLSGVKDGKLRLKSKNGEMHEIPFSAIDRYDFLYINRYLRSRKKKTIELPYYQISESLRAFIPSLNQSDFGRGRYGIDKTCGPNACVNYLLWWQELGLIQTPIPKSNSRVSDYLHAKLDRFMSSRTGTNEEGIRRGLEKYFEEYPVKHYNIEISRMLFSIEEATKQCSGSNMVIASLQIIQKNRMSRGGGHWVSLVECDKNGLVQFNTWGKRFYGRVVPGINGGKKIYDIELMQDPGNNFTMGEGSGFAIEESDIIFVTKLTAK